MLNYIYTCIYTSFKITYDVIIINNKIIKCIAVSTIIRLTYLDYNKTRQNTKN